MFKAIGILAVALGMALSQSAHAWTASTVNGYTYYTEGQNIACPLANPGGQIVYYQQYRYGQNGSTESVIILPQQDGTQQVVYLSPTSGIYDLYQGAWHRRPSCSLAEAKRFKDNAIRTHHEKANDLLAAYYYARRWEAEAFFNACAAYGS